MLLPSYYFFSVTIIFIVILVVEFSKNKDDEIYQLFLDPSANHLIVSMTSGESLYLGRNNKKPRLLAKIKVNNFFWTICIVFSSYYSYLSILIPFPIFPYPPILILNFSIVFYIVILFLHNNNAFWLTTNFPHMAWVESTELRI